MAALVRIKQLSSALPPRKATYTSAGLDVFLPVSVELPPLIPTKIGLGIALDFPPDLFCTVEVRSSQAKKGVIALGRIIDPDFKDQVFAILLNTSSSPITFERNDCVVQLVFHHLPVVQIELAIGGAPWHNW